LRRRQVSKQVWAEIMGRQACPCQSRSSGKGDEGVVVIVVIVMAVGLAGGGTRRTRRTKTRHKNKTQEKHSLVKRHRLRHLPLVLAVHPAPGLVHLLNELDPVPRDRHVLGPDGVLHVVREQGGVHVPADAGSERPAVRVYQHHGGLSLGELVLELVGGVCDSSSTKVVNDDIVSG